MLRLAALCALGMLALTAAAQEPYKLPPKEIVDVIDTPMPPAVSFSPARNALLLVESKPYPSIEYLAQPFVRLAGVRIRTSTASAVRTSLYNGLEVRFLRGGRRVRIPLPAGSIIGMPAWSPDGSRIAFTREAKGGLELWVAETTTGTARRIPAVLVTDVIDEAFSWAADNTSLLVRSIPAKRGAPPAAPQAPPGPNTDETIGKVSKTPTYQDLLRTPHDGDLFAYYATTQLALVNTKSGTVKPVGAPGLITGAEHSPDGKYLLVERLRRPFSLRVPYNSFPRNVEVWTAAGSPVKTVAELPVADDVPTQGVPTGPRGVQWQPLRDARLVWVEALDGGDPVRKVPARDRVMSLEAPFGGVPAEIFRVEHRFTGTAWLPEPDLVLVTEYDRDRRWRREKLLSLRSPSDATTLADLSVNDAYNDPGSPVQETDARGDRTVVREGNRIFRAGRGATPAGDRPFLRSYDLVTGETKELFRCDENSLEQFVGFAAGSRSAIVTRRETRTEPPNMMLRDLAAGGVPDALTDFKDPAPQLSAMKKTLLTYGRKDGVRLSGTLYLPPSRREGERLPLVVWAYPLEYSDAGTAGQVRGSPSSFTFFRGATPLFYVTQGYAVLMDATMPVVGDPETVNNTFVEQIVSSAKAAIDTLDAMGVADRSRVMVSGHSYGAFMTANLLAHSDLFAAGVARSGAYNRTLTPFGFQSERRSFWEARDVYVAMSPFTYADRINEPLLLIHGEADNNQGTFPVQSERLFQALRGNGGTARLVMLPFESHGYSARESILHVIAESLEWADRHVRKRAAVPVMP